MTTNLDVAAGNKSPTTVLIGDEWRAASGGGAIDMHAPSDGQVFARIAAGTAEDIDAAVAAAHQAYENGEWGRLTAVERGRLMMKLGERILAQAEEFAELEATDTGKPMAQARADIAASARYFEYYGAAADKVHGDTIPFMNGYQVMTVYEPFGVTGHIIPWNYPAQMIGRTLGPALAMGNATVLKPAEDACMTPLRIGALAAEVGFPAGAINIVTGYGTEAGAALTAHPGIGFLAFTGSPAVGTLVQKATAENHIGCVLELGGKSPQIVFDDADIDAVLPVVVGAIVQNGGQTCSAGSRVLVQESIFEDFTRRLAERFSQIVTARHDADRNCGPLISRKQQQRVKKFLEQARADSIPVIAQGQLAEGTPEAGYYVAPTLLGPVPRDNVIAREEVFGPVLGAIPFTDEDDAIQLANSTDYGLIAGVWTRDGARQMRVAKAMRCGQVYINGYGAGGGIELPFGGVKKSGHGREKGFAALHEFATLKTIIIKHD